MGQIAADLGALLQTKHAGDHLPFLPLFNAAQVMHAQVQYLDFKSGMGVTSDGKYYIAAVLPVSHPELPAGSEVDEQLVNDFPGYLSNTVSLLNGQPAESLSPDLNQLDALIRSIEVK